MILQKIRIYLKKYTEDNYIFKRKNVDENLNVFHMEDEQSCTSYALNELENN